MIVGEIDIDAENNEDNNDENNDTKNEDINIIKNEIDDLFKIKDKKKINKKNITQTEDESDSDSDEEYNNVNNYQTNVKDDFDDFDDFDNFDNNNFNTEWDDDFNSPGNDLNRMMNDIIEIKSQARGRKKTTIVIGLKLSEEKEKQFLTKIKKTGVTGNKKSVNEEELSSGSYHKDKSKKGQPKPKNIPKIEIFIFTGDCKDKIEEILINDFGVNEDSIKC